MMDLFPVLADVLFLGDIDTFFFTLYKISCQDLFLKVKFNLYNAFGPYIWCEDPFYYLF